MLTSDATCHQLSCCHQKNKKALGLLRWTLNIGAESVKEQAYRTFVRLVLQYAGSSPSVCLFWSFSMLALVLKYACSGPSVCLFWSFGMLALVLQYACSGPSVCLLWSLSMLALVLKYACSAP